MTDIHESIAQRNQWLLSLKAGDQAAIPRRYEGGGRIVTVERVTATQIVAGGDRYRREGGRIIGGNSWNFGSLQPLTPELIEGNERIELQHWLQELSNKRRTLPVATLRAMKEAYESAGLPQEVTA